jgi:pantoate--beta-alanine ligase
MKIIHSINQMASVSKRLRADGQTIGFVPTMGALHEGHLSLIRKARKENDVVVVSIFVNPIQFGPQEDYRRYPRNLRQDARLCSKEGVDIIFYPKTEDMYPKDYKTFVFVEDLSEVLCGKFRPGHFSGVATVVAKLFNIVMPDIAYFGQKDAQQAIIIQRMAKDLNMAVKIKVMPTVREKDDLALSSRNAYLSKSERKDAAVLYQALNLARDLIKQGNRDPFNIIRKMKQLINKKKSVKIQYISILDLKDLKTLVRIKDKVLVVLAVWLGKTRLIDNLIVNY